MSGLLKDMEAAKLRQSVVLESLSETLGQGPGPRTPMIVRDRVASDLVHPGRQSFLPLERRQALVDLEEGLLQDVVSIGRVGYVAQNEPLQTLSVLLPHARR
jgi:hypothetical protein